MKSNRGSLVGPSSPLLAMMASGMNGQSFTFHGYLPLKRRKKASFKSLKKFLSNKINLKFSFPIATIKLLKIYYKLNPETIYACY
jgi:16S rRNA (cytidine1402-2'-O)-methyltransferase